MIDVEICIIYTWMLYGDIGSVDYSTLHLECHSISISILNRIGLFSTERAKKT